MYLFCKFPPSPSIVTSFMDALDQRKGKELEGAMEVGSVVRVLRDFLTLNEAQ